MSGVNKVILIGRLGKDPERRQRQNGADYATFSMATSKKVRDEERTTWHSVTVWSESSAKYITDFACKGSLVYVEGEIETRRYEKDGVTHYATEIVVGQYNGNVSIMADGVGRGDNREDRAPAAGRRETGGSRRPPATRTTVNTPLPADVDPLDDEIPF